MGKILTLLVLVAIVGVVLAFTFGIIEPGSIVRFVHGGG